MTWSGTKKSRISGEILRFSFQLRPDAVIGKASGFHEGEGSAFGLAAGSFGAA